MPTVKQIVILLVTTLISLTLMVPLASAYPRGCGYSRSQRVGIRVDDASKCTYGWEVDACGNQICTKGPGEVCGGKNQRYGVCGEGT